jgi:hypothetical protein
VQPFLWIQKKTSIEMSINANLPFFFLDLMKHGFTLAMNKYWFNDNQSILAEAFGVIVCRLLSIEVPISNQQQQQRYSGSPKSDNATFTAEVAELAPNEYENSMTRNKSWPPAADDTIAVSSLDINEIALETNNKKSKSPGLRRSSFSKHTPVPSGSLPKRVQFKSPLITVRVVDSDESSSGYSNSDSPEFSDSDDEGEAVRVSDITDELDLPPVALDAQIKFWQDYHMSTKFKTIC